ncbi:MAG: GGDEF domain-containing protein [Chloroflexi bacterium]|nr:GGDEF domain-containing protein [Chloroflexota bacterium]MCA2002365.1 GGDEF domain-containing protein [Chloroflexota bacterium]
MTLKDTAEDVYNIDVFQVLLKYEIERSKRYPCPLTLLQIETNPAAVNPQTLKAAPLIFASALSAHLRAADIPARTGNLFTVLLTNADRHGAQAVCERLLSVFKNKLEDGAGNSIAFSLQIGATSHPGGETLDMEKLIQKTEEALQQAKKKGQNVWAFSA